MREERAAHIERNVHNYDAEALDDAPFIADQLTKVSTLCKTLGSLQPRARVAEVGSFTGYAAEQYARVPGVTSMTCFDLSPQAVARCRARGLQAAQWNADAEPCPAADASFDVVMAPDVIEHLLRPEHLLGELHRVCATGGHLILSTPNLAFWLNRVRMLLGRVPWSYPGVSSTTKLDSAIDLNHLRISTASEWSELLRVCGWKVQQTLTYSLLDDRPTDSLRAKVLKAVDRIAGQRPSLAFGLIFVCDRVG